MFDMTWLLLIPTLVVLSYPLHAAWLFRRQRRALRPATGCPQGCRISVIVPVRGLDEAVEANLASWLDQHLPEPWELLICVEDEDDPVVAVVHRVQQRARGGHQCRRLRLLITGTGSASLGKMHNLLSGIAAARGDLLVFVDSDARFPDLTYVQRFVRPLADPAVGLVTCYPAYRGARSLGAALVGSAINNDMLGFMGVTGTWRRLQLAVGTTLAMRRDTVQALGGLEFLRRQLLMDVTLARQVSAAGLRVHLCPEPVGVHLQRSTVVTALQQADRWHIGMRRVLPWPVLSLYLGLRSTLPLAAVAAVVTGRLLPVALAAGFIAARVAAAAALDRTYLRDPSLRRHFWLVPLVDLVMFASAMSALLRRRIWWRGRRYEIGRGGVALREITGEETFAASGSRWAGAKS